MIGGALLAFVTAACVVSLWAALLERLAPARVSLESYGQELLSRIRALRARVLFRFS